MWQKVAAKVIAHIAGPSGSGKTTLVNKLNKRRNNLIAVDLDQFDEEAEKQLGWERIRKKNYTSRMLKTLAGRRQTLMDNYIKSSKKPIVFAGHHYEDKHVLRIPTKNRFLLDVNAKTSARRAYRRSQKEAPRYRRLLSELPQDIKEAQEDINKLRKLHYKPMSPRDIIKRVEGKR
jgi:adenylylsulfate kinase-like enzyme